LASETTADDDIISSHKQRRLLT